MERAQLSMADGKERKSLIAAREQLHLSQEEVAERLGVSKATVHRWEKKGDIPQPYHLRELCKLFEASARELGFDEKYAVDGLHIDGLEEEIEEDVLVAFRKENSTSRLMSIVWNWSKRDTRYQMLQVAILMELEDNSMDDEISRRDALRFLALVPVDMLGLSQVGAAFMGSHEDVLTYCAAGVTACWYLRKGKDLLFANQTVSKYIPTLKAAVQSAPAIQRKAAAALLAQCFLLKAPLAWNLTTTSDAIYYARQAEAFSVIAGSRLLQITALRTTAAALCYANQWEQALQAAEKAKYLLEQKEQSTPLQPAEEPIPQLVSSYVYAGLATYRAYDGRKEDAFHVLKKAHTTFFERSTDEKVPPWVDHNIGNLLINDGETRLHLGLYKEAINSLEEINTQYAQDTTISLTGRINSLLNQVMAEVSRDDQPRDMEWCIDRWKRGIEGAKTVQSQRHFNEAIQAYTAMRVAWPGEMRIKDLRDHIVHW
jgi:transcriptional regulator with XRE-family HTH domain